MSAVHQAFPVYNSIFGLLSRLVLLIFSSVKTKSQKEHISTEDSLQKEEEGTDQLLSEFCH